MAYKYETTEPGRAHANAWQSAPDMVREGDGMIERIKLTQRTLMAQQNQQSRPGHAAP